jgi:hypothetical protein
MVPLVVNFQWKDDGGEDQKVAEPFYFHAWSYAYLEMIEPLHIHSA